MANRKGKEKTSDSNHRTRKRPAAESDEEVVSSRPSKKSAVNNLTEAERQAIFKEMTRKAQAKKKAQKERETEGAFL